MVRPHRPRPAAPRRPRRRLPPKRARMATWRCRQVLRLTRFTCSAAAGGRPAKGSWSPAIDANATGFDRPGHRCDRSVGRRRWRSDGQCPTTPAKVAALVEQSQYGPLPKVGDDGKRPAEAYAAQTRYAGKAAPGEPARIAILVEGIGLPNGVSMDVIKGLPASSAWLAGPMGAICRRGS